MDNRASPSGERNTDTSRRRRRTQEVQLRGMSPPPRTSHSTPAIDSRVPLHITRARVFANPGPSHIQRHRLRRQREDDAFGTVADAVNRLNEVTSSLTSALDEPLPQILGPDEFTGLIDDMDGYNRRSKRRKLDSDPLDAQPSFSYGYHGQVAPGRLKMVISSCDGGHMMNSDSPLAQRLSQPDNILRNDKSVYTSKKDKCNIVLKHWGETPFTVTKIIVKAPDLSFPAPVQEGMVFISMSNEQLTTRTAHYQIREVCPHTLPRPPNPNSDRALGSQENHGRAILNSRYYSQRYSQRPRQSFSRLPPLEANATTTTTTYFYPPVSSTDSPDTDATPPPDEVYPHDYFSRASVVPTRYSEPFAQPGYRITTSCDDPSGDEEEPSSPTVIADRQQRMRRIEESSTSDEDDDPHPIRYHRQRCVPRRIEWVDKDPDSENVKPPQESMPSVKFFIERRKYVVSMKFDPPISGRYILVKLWSPQGQPNIDVQNISVYGYAGPRFFPSISAA